MLALLFSAVTASAQQTYLGMDRNDYPSDAAMATLHKTFAFTGYWLNNPPGANRNSWQGKRAALQAMGYGFLLLFNGREYAQLKASGNAARVGANDAAAAVHAAEHEGFPKTAILFLDQEQGGRMLPEQRAYIHAWIDGVTHAGYRGGVYCSGIPFRESGGVSVVTAERHSRSRRLARDSFLHQQRSVPASARLRLSKDGAEPRRQWSAIRRRVAVRAESAASGDDGGLQADVRERCQLLSAG